MGKLRPSPRADDYLVMREAVERGAGYGWRRAFKHTDTPSEDIAVETIATAVMNEICEWFRFDEEK